MDWFANAAPRLTKSGPGHKPASPQPVPKMAPPRMSLVSMFPGSGRSNSSPKVGALHCFLMSMTPGIIAAKAAPMRTANDGSQVLCVNWKKVDTFAGLTIPPTHKPTPKRTPVAPWTADLTTSAAREPLLMMMSFLARYAMVANPANEEAMILPYNALSACVAAAVFVMAFTAATAFPFPVSVTTCNKAFVLNIVAARAPKIINVHTFTIERDESRPIPESPCPLVQPPPNFDPNPTKNNANANREVPSMSSNPPAGSKCDNPKCGKTVEVASIPTMQGNFSDKNSFDIPSTGSTNPDAFKAFPF